MNYLSVCSGIEAASLAMKITMKARVMAVHVDCNDYIYASVYGPLLEDGSSVRFDAAFCPEEDLPGLHPLVLASIALGHKVEIDLLEGGDGSFTVVALRLSEKTQAARVLRIAAEMLPWTDRRYCFSTLEKASLIVDRRVAEIAETQFFQHLEATGRKCGTGGVTWNAFTGHSTIESVDKDALLKEQIKAFLCVADKLDSENDDED